METDSKAQFLKCRREKVGRQATDGGSGLAPLGSHSARGEGILREGRNVAISKYQISATSAQSPECTIHESVTRPRSACT